MELLTTSQRQILLEFKERVRQHETKQKIEFNYKDNSLNLSSMDPPSHDLPRIYEKTNQQNESTIPTLSYQKSPER